MNYDDVLGGQHREHNEHEISIEQLILDLSLASAFPVGVERNKRQLESTASIQTLAYRTENMQKHELKELQFVMGPLLGLLAADLKHPNASKASQAIRALIPSRACLNQFVACNGFMIMGKVLDILLVGATDLTKISPPRTIVESLCTVYREAARFFPDQIVFVGALRHCVRVLSLGDSTLRGIAASVLSILSNSEKIVLQMFTYGAIAPILRISRLDSSEPELLAGLGCIVQLSRQPDIAVRVASQGAVPLLEAALHLMESRTPGVAAAVRNKSLLAFAWLSRVEAIRARLATATVFRGMERELKSNAANNQTLVLQMMINLRAINVKPRDDFNRNVRDRILELMSSGLWFSRNLTTKTLCLIYTSPDDKLYCAKNGALAYICQLIRAKTLDLQEVPMVALLSFCVHPDIPFMILEQDYHLVIVDVLYAVNETIREMAVILLKALILYDRAKVLAAIPVDREFLMKIDPESDPVVYGSEYGGLIQQYLARIIENRREMKYLLENFSSDLMAEQNITEEELESFQSTFMILDFNCNGVLGLDEIKVLMVIMGEKLDEEELQLLFNEYDEDKSGEMSFPEFCIMMKNWRTRFGSGATKVYNEFLQRGAIGKGRRALANWLNKDELDRQEVEKIKQAKIKAEIAKQAAMEKHMGAEKLRVQRAQEKALQEKKLREMQEQTGSLPPI